MTLIVIDDSDDECVSKQAMPALEEANESIKAGPDLASKHRNRYFEVGSTCHQCRQKPKDAEAAQLMAICKGVARVLKGVPRACTQRYCPKCLLNRYGEGKPKLKKWQCPRCRGVCNCSVCMKKKGLVPTGNLTSTAKATGFASVAHLLNQDKKGSRAHKQNKNATNNANGCAKSHGRKDEKSGHETRRLRELDANCQVTKPEKQKKRKAEPQTDTPATHREADKSRAHKSKKRALSKAKLKEADVLPEPTDNVTAAEVEAEVEVEKANEEIVLPSGEKLDSVAGFQLPQNAIGPAFQLLEFLSAFVKLLDFRKEEVDAMLRELFNGAIRRRSSKSLITNMHIKLLTLIFEGKEKPYPKEKEWLTILKDYLTELPVLANMYPVREERAKLLQSLDGDYFADLDVQMKLELLNILCDDCLSTTKFRTYMQTLFNETKEQLSVARKEAKEAAQKKRDAEVEKQMALQEGNSLTADQQQELIQKVREESEKVASARIAISDVITNRRNCKVIRIEPLAVVNNERAFWRLQGILAVQDVSERRDGSTEEKWTCYSEDQEELLNKYLASKSLKKSRGQQQ